jgi:hypothetical protein
MSDNTKTPSPQPQPQPQPQPGRDEKAHVEPTRPWR